MPRDAAELAHRLARDAEAVCRHYLSNGRREGRYWLVGDVAQYAGPLAVRPAERVDPKGPAGKWTDAATGEHGDLLDLIRDSRGLRRFPRRRRRGAALPEACPARTRRQRRKRTSPAQTGSPEAARRLFAMSQPIARTLAETYLRNRGITALHEDGALRFHPRCYYRPDEDAPTETWPALIARVTDLDGRITGVHRTWLDPSTAAARRRSTRRDARWAIFSATPCASVWRTTCSRPAKASRPCCRCAACCRPCRWSRHSRPTTSPPCCSRRRCAGSISPATTMRPATRAGQL